MSKIIKILSILALFVSGASYADIKFWTTEVQPARMAKQEEWLNLLKLKQELKLK